MNPLTLARLALRLAVRPMAQRYLLNVAIGAAVIATKALTKPKKEP